MSRARDHQGELRDELLNVEAFETLLEVQVLAEDFRMEYSTYTPRSSLGQLAPAEFVDRCSNRPVHGAQSVTYDGQPFPSCRTPNIALRGELLGLREVDCAV